MKLTRQDIVDAIKKGSVEIKPEQEQEQHPDLDERSF